MPPESRIERTTSSEDMFSGNTSVVERELYYATLLLNLMKNQAYLLFEEP